MSKPIYIFATNNKHKFHEVNSLISETIALKSLNELSFHEEIPETQETIEGNAKQKAQYIYDRFGENCFADDTGLEIEALNGEPGVYSARYAGENCSFNDNMEKVLSKLQGIENRKACFRTVICLIENGQYHFFEGRVNGIITRNKSGVEGFGYDPIFQADGMDKTFAEITLEEKNQISHRALATKKLIEYFSTK
jgi:XTP/dITP diphosphohydrolase